jgi:hypothetical protein
MHTVYLFHSCRRRQRCGTLKGHFTGLTTVHNLLGMTGCAVLYYSSHCVNQGGRRQSKRPQGFFYRLCFGIQTSQINFSVGHQFSTLLHGPEPRAEFANSYENIRVFDMLMPRVHRLTGRELPCYISTL